MVLETEKTNLLGEMSVYFVLSLGYFRNLRWRKCLLWLQRGHYEEETVGFVAHSGQFLSNVKLSGEAEFFTAGKIYLAEIKIRR